MKNMHRFYKYCEFVIYTRCVVVMVLSFFGLLNYAHAGTTTMDCKLVIKVSTTIPLNGITVSAGPDVPVGTVLYHAGLKDNQGSHEAIHCDFKYDGANLYGFYFRHKYTFSGNMIDATQKIFSTNIPGIGVKYWWGWSGTNAFPGTWSGATVITGWNSAFISMHPSVYANWYTDTFPESSYETSIQLIKTGPVTPGVLTGASLGSLSTQLEFKPSTSNGSDITIIPKTLFDISYVNFSGTINITTPSCKTPENVAVDLGEYTTASITSQGVTPWKDASITLTDCPVFYGSPGKSPNYWNSNWYNGTGQSSSVSPNVSNKLGIIMNGNNGNLDSANGIVGIFPASAAAQGVAIQLGRGNTSTTTYVPLGVEFTQDIPMTGLRNIKIPLVARIVKRGDVKGGSVVSYISYTINYK